MNGKPIMGSNGWMVTGWRVLAVGSMVAAGGAAPSGLVLHCNFDKAPVNGVVADLSGKKNPCQLAGATWTKAGKKGGGLDCTTGEGGLRVPGNPVLNVKKATVAAWFKVPKATADERLLVGRGGLRLVIGGEGNARGKLAVKLQGGPRCVSDAIVTNGGWHFAVATLDGARLKLYVDGKLQKQDAACQLPVPPVPPGVFVGCDPAAGEEGKPLGGIVDEVMVFNRALTASEINTLGAAIDPKIVVPVRKFSKRQLAGQIRMLDMLYDEGLLEDKYYTRKMRELEEAMEE